MNPDEDMGNFAVLQREIQKAVPGVTLYTKEEKYSQSENFNIMLSGAYDKTSHDAIQAALIAVWKASRASKFKIQPYIFHVSRNWSQIWKCVQI